MKRRENMPMSEAKSLTMNCLEFERILDRGEPWSLPIPAMKHVLDCPSCGRSLARAHSLEAALRLHFARESAADAVPTGFTDRVMARVERGEARGVRWLALPDAQPWWVRAASDPAVVLACGVVALMLWRGDGLVAAARAWAAVTAATPSLLAQAVRFVGLDALGPAFAAALAPGGGAAWAIPVGLTLGLLPAFWLMAVAAWRAGERLGGLRQL